MAVNRLFTDRKQYFDGNGDPLAGGKLFVYLAGSTTKATTYSDSAGSVPNTNPLVLDSAGRLQVELYVTTGSTYKLVLTTSSDSDPPASPIWTEDNIPVINDTVVSLDEWVSTGLTPTYVSGTSFTVSGDQRTQLHVGRRLKSTNTSGTIYSTITASSYSDPSTTITVANDSGSLDSGLSTVYMGLLSSANTSLPRPRDDTFILQDNSDPTKRIAFQLSGITTATTRTWTFPDSDQTFVGLTSTQTLTSKTLTSPTISGTPAISGATITTSTLAGGHIWGQGPTATTSGTEVDFTSIPSWVNRLTIIFNGVSLSGTADLLVQIGDSGGVENSGYAGTYWYGASAVNSAQLSAGFFAGRLAGASATVSGTVMLMKLDSTTWICMGSSGQTNTAGSSFTNGAKSLTGTLDRVRFTTTNGTDTFDAGSVKLIYE